MPIVNLAINIPDAQLARVQSALKAKYASNGTPNPTNAQAMEGLRQEVLGIIKGTVLAFEQAAASAAVNPVDPA
jgi:hypothetical protein